MNARLVVLVLSLLSILLTLWSRDFILFWDTIQFTGKHGSWFYEQGAFVGLLPKSLDSGHPPFFGIYQTSLWSIFGKNLTVSSLSMLPFLIMNIYFAVRIGQRQLAERFWLFPVAMLMCPFYLGHSILISPDVILVTGFLMCFYGILAFKRTYIYLGSILLAIISIRGAAVCLALVLFHAFFLSKASERPKLIIKKLAWLYLPAILCILGFQLWHYIHNSWIGFHDDSPWSASFQLIDLVSLAKNAAVFVWRLLDFGMIAPYAVLGYLMFTGKSRPPHLGLFCILLAIFALLILPFHGLLNHRYFLPLQLLVLLMALESLKEMKIRYSVVMMALMFSGNFIIYPDKIAQGWDSTAAHWPYYNLEKTMHEYITDTDQIDLTDIGTAFPLRVERRFLDLSNDKKGYRQYNLDYDNYILYSNVMNEFSDEELSTLKNWAIVKEIKKGGIRFTLYANPTKLN